MKYTLLVAVTLSSLSSTLVAQGARKPIEGAWRIVQVDTVKKPASLVIFARAHYSMFYNSSNAARVTWKDPAKGTNEEKVAAYDGFVANTGTYDIVGTTLTIHPIVARAPNFAAGGSDKYQFRIQGDTLWLTEKSSDFRTRIGAQVGTPPGPVTEQHITLVRAE